MSAASGAESRLTTELLAAGGDSADRRVAGPAPKDPDPFDEPHPSHYGPAPGRRRNRGPRLFAQRDDPPAMPAAPPVFESSGIVEPVPSRQVDLPPAPVTRPLSDAEQFAATQAARAAAARVAATTSVPPPALPHPGIRIPPADPHAEIAAPTASSIAVDRPVDRGSEPLPAASRSARAMPPGETGIPVVEGFERGPRLTRREQKELGRLRARKVRRVIRHIEPWSVFKLSLIYYLCLFVTFLVAATLLWNLAASAGTIQNVVDFLSDLVQGEFEINGAVLFRAALFGGLVLVIAGALFNVLLAVLFNLISDLVGGIRVTVIEEENVRRRAAADRVAEH